MFTYRNVALGLLTAAVLWAGGLTTWVVVTDSSGLSDRARWERCEEVESVLEEIEFERFFDLVERPTEEWDEYVADKERSQKYDDVRWDKERYCQ